MVCVCVCCLSHRACVRAVQCRDINSHGLLELLCDIVEGFEDGGL